ncbi:MAG: CapA family protein [Cellulosilyticum sp.]|nr:CapA family protein [Cellulosilyticum sp.]
MGQKKWGRFCLILTLALTLITHPKEAIGQENTTVEVSYNESYRNQGVTFVNAKQLLNKLGYKAEWEQSTKRLKIDEGRIYIKLNSKVVETDQGSYILTADADIREGGLYIPLDFFADILGYDVKYEDGDITIKGEENLGVKGRYEEIITTKQITISAAGDFTLGYYKGQASGGRFDEVAKANGNSYFMKNVKEVFEADDLTIVNLEGPLTTRGVGKEKEFTIRGLPNYTEILKAGSIETVNLANNHTYDYGSVGYTDTVTFLDKAGVGYFGEDTTQFITVNDIKVALIGANGWTSGQDVKNKLKKRIEAAKIQADLIIVEFHWGIEREHYPNSTQQNLAKYVIDQGVHLVLGSHPHVIQGIGSYKGANIVYSMGNFCFGANKNPADKDTFIYQETFVLTADGIQSEGHEVIPCRISSTTNRNNYQPTILEGTEKDKVLARIEQYSKNLKG